MSANLFVQNSQSLHARGLVKEGELTQLEFANRQRLRRGMGDKSCRRRHDSEVGAP
jgi:hypothetical protein